MFIFERNCYVGFDVSKALVLWKFSIKNAFVFSKIWVFLFYFPLQKRQIPIFKYHICVLSILFWQISTFVRLCGLCLWHGGLLIKQPHACQKKATEYFRSVEICQKMYTFYYVYDTTTGFGVCRVQFFFHDMKL